MGCEREVFTGIESKNPENNKLHITSTPSKAKIYINGRNTGFVTPFTLNWLESRKDTIGLKLYLFRDTTFVTEFKNQAEQNYFIDFASNPGNYGNISFVSTPLGAYVSMYKSKTSYTTTPCTFSRVLAGVYSFFFSKVGHRTDSIKVTLPAGKTVLGDVVLEDTTKWVSYKPENSQVKSNLVYSIAIDNHNNAWIGSSEGLSKFNGLNWKVYTRNNSILRSDEITALHVDRQNRVLIGTDNGIYLIENEIVRDISFNLYEQSVVDIAESSDGAIWTALNGGIAKLNGNSWQLYTKTNSGLKDNNPLCIEIDNQDKVWIGSRHNGISIFDNNKWSYIPTSSMNIPNIESGVNSICFDENGTVWIGTISLSTLDFGKLVYRKDNVWYLFSKNDLNSNLVRKIVSHKGNIVFATSLGLGIISKSGNYSFFRSGNSKLYELLLNSVAVDKYDNIWLATYSCGAAKLKKALE